jgi:sulfide:quinone oxidoreductase
MKKKVVILGGGFAGVQAAKVLQKQKGFQVTLISNRDYLYLYPVSIWVPTGEKKFEDVKVNLYDISVREGFNVYVDDIVDIRTANKTVVCGHKIFRYDYLIVAVGAEKVLMPGHEHALSICGKPETSLEIKQALNKLITKGSGHIAVGFGGNPKDKSAVRGGPAFELLFNIHHLLTKLHIRENFELTFFAPMVSPGERMGPKALAMLDKLFTKLSIGKRFGKKISAFDAAGVTFEDGSTLPSDLILFIPATAGHSAFKKYDLPLNDAGFIKIDNTCKVQGSDSIYAIGDCAAIEGPGWIAKQGHIAELMGRAAAFNIIAQASGRNDRKTYQEHLNILCVMDTGNGAAFVYRDDKRAFAIPMPYFGHWLKKGWGWYAKMKALGYIPRIPGL